MSIFKGLKTWVGGDSEEEYDDDEEFEEGLEPKDSSDDFDFNHNKEKEVNNFMETSNYHTNKGLLQYKLFNPTEYDNTVYSIADQIKDGSTVMLNLDNTNSDAARRIFDFLSGVSYAKGGCVLQLSQRTFMITPSQVDFESEASFDRSELV